MLPQGIEQIGKYSFAGSGLKTISIPRSVFWVGEGVYSDCKRLNNVVVPDNIISIPDKMFSGCDSLSEIKLPETVDSIGADAFRDCSSLQSIVIPESVHSIGETLSLEHTRSLRCFVTDSPRQKSTQEAMISRFRSFTEVWLWDY